MRRQSAKTPKFWFVAIGLVFLCLWQEAMATTRPSFDCGKAGTKTEKLICNDEGLAALDNQLASGVKEVKEKYKGELLSQFLEGQRKWLKLRDEACPARDNRLNPAALTQCLVRVYNERLKELREQSSVATMHPPPTSPALDAVLDADRKLAAYYPEEMSSLYFSSGNDFDFKTSRIPHTCRELYTLAAGAWTYSGDTIGNQSRATALGTCQSALLSANSQADNRLNQTKIDFSDMILFSGEFLCLMGFSEDTALSDNPASFKDLQRKGLLKIGQNTVDQPGENEPQKKEIPTIEIEGSKLTISSTEFSATHLNIWHMSVGNFTNQNRQEALLNLTIFPDLGSYRDTELRLAYYDVATHSIRPEKLDTENLFTARSKPLPRDYCQGG